MPWSLTLQHILDANASLYCIVCKEGNKQMLYLKFCLKNPGSFQQAPQTCASTASCGRQGVVLKNFVLPYHVINSSLKKPLLVTGSVGRRANLPPTGTLSNPWKEYQWFTLELALKVFISYIKSRSCLSAKQEYISCQTFPSRDGSFIIEIMPIKYLNLFVPVMNFVIPRISS